MRSDSDVGASADGKSGASSLPFADDEGREEEVKEEEDAEEEEKDIDPFGRA